MDNEKLLKRLPTGTIAAILLLFAVLLCKSGIAPALIVPPGLEADFGSDIARGFINSNGFYTVVSRGNYTTLSDGTHGYYLEFDLQSKEGEPLEGMYYVDAVVVPNIVNRVFTEPDGQTSKLVKDYVPYIIKDAMESMAKTVSVSDISKDSKLEEKIDNMVANRVSYILFQYGIYTRNLKVLIYQHKS